MKSTLPIALIASLGIATAGDESENYLNFIVQKHIGTHGVPTKIDDLASFGSSTALDGVTGSSVFQLWTVHRTNATAHLLDEKIVSSYHPEAKIVITSRDPHPGIPRTRVDQPFTVDFTVSGLITNDEDVQDAAKSVVLEHKITSYQDGGVAGDPEVDTTNTVGGLVDTIQGVISQNGTTSENRLTMLKAPDLTKVSGEEEFTIYARPDFGVNESHQLASAKVQIWPIASASMTGIDTSKKYMQLPDVHIDLKDLYPDSTTYVRIYEGKPATSPKEVHIINTSYVIIDDTKPQDRKFSLSGSELGISTSGDYTLEIVHVTPFGVDLLSQTYPLNKKNKIRVIGNLNSSE